MLNINKFRGNFDVQEILIIILTGLSQFSALFLSTMISVALPTISLELNISAELLNWISIIFLMSVIAFSVPFAKILSNYGVKKCTIIGIIILLFGIFLSVFSTNFELFLVSRFIQGISIAIFSVSPYMMIILGIKEENVGKALGIAGSIGFIGLTLAPSVTGFVVSYFSWRYAFLVCVPFLILQLIVIYFINGEWKEERHIDWGGSLLFLCVIITLIYGLSNIVTDGYISLIVFFVLLIIFNYYEKNQEYPIVNVNLYKNSKFTLGCFVAIIGTFVFFIVPYLTSLYFQIVLGLNPVISGLILLIPPVFMIFLGSCSGFLSDKYDLRYIMLVGLITLILSMIVLAVKHIPFYLVILALTLEGVGFGILFTPGNMYVLLSVPEEDLPDASSLLSSSRDLGQVLSLAIFNILCALLMGDTVLTENAPNMILSFNMLLNISIIIMLVTIIIFIKSEFSFKEIISNILNSIKKDNS